MRKRFKKKKLSCGLCKPNKTNGEVRWKAKEFLMLKDFEKQKSHFTKLI